MTASLQSRVTSAATAALEARPGSRAMRALTGQQPLTQPQLDAMTFDLYVDCELSASETARQSGISSSTVRARVRRHSRRA